MVVQKNKGYVDEYIHVESTKGLNMFQFIEDNQLIAKRFRIEMGKNETFILGQNILSTMNHFRDNIESLDVRVSCRNLNICASNRTCRLFFEDNNQWKPKFTMNKLKCITLQIYHSRHHQFVIDLLHLVCVHKKLLTNDSNDQSILFTTMRTCGADTSFKIELATSMLNETFDIIYKLVVKLQYPICLVIKIRHS